MRKRIYTLQDTLAHQLKGLYFGEQKIKVEFEDCEAYAASTRLKEEIGKYIGEAADKVLKLERIFNYLMQEPDARRNKVIVRLIEDTHEMLSYTDSPHLRDILLVSCLQNLNGYKISCLKIAYMFTVELEMDTASDLIQQILESELETARALSALAIEEFNRNQDLLIA